jgi:hypothetical protein
VSGSSSTRTHTHAQDFVITTVLAVFWLFAAIGWAFSAGSLTNESGSTNIQNKVLLVQYAHFNRCVHR